MEQRISTESETVRIWNERQFHSMFSFFIQTFCCMRSVCIIHLISARLRIIVCCHKINPLRNNRRSVACSIRLSYTTYIAARSFMSYVPSETMEKGKKRFWLFTTINTQCDISDYNGPNAFQARWACKWFVFLPKFLIKINLHHKNFVYACGLWETKKEQKEGRERWEVDSSHARSQFNQSTSRNIKFLPRKRANWKLIYFAAVHVL